MSRGQLLFIAASGFMLLDALLYSIGALVPLQRMLQTADSYKNRRLQLNLLLANAGLYFTGGFALIGALGAATPSTFTRFLMGFAAVTCLYSALTVPVLTPKDWLHTLPRAVALILILIGLVV
jgi:hypothetical protein